MSQIGVTVLELRVFKVTMEEIFKQLVESWCLEQSCSPDPGDDRYENLNIIGVTVPELRVFKVTMEEIFKQFLEGLCLH